MAVTYTFSANSNIVASELNTNFSDLVSQLSSISASQLAGGITSDKITDRFVPSWDTICVVPYCSSASMATGTPFTAPSSSTVVAVWTPRMKAGVEGYLCGISVRGLQTAGSAPYPRVTFVLNGSTTIGYVDVEVADNEYLIATSDPITNPLQALADGDYVDIQLGPSTSGTPNVGGLYVTFIIKYPLVG